MSALPPFAAAQSRVNEAVQARLANALASLAGGPAIPVLFEAEYQTADGGEFGLAASRPAITLPTAQVPSPATGVSLDLQTATGTSAWRIAEHHPDGTGLSTLLIERA